MYHFLSGYTAQVAGTEVGLGKEPKAVFSTCFGAPFMPRHPSVYAQMLGERIARYGADCWLVNTGWSGGAYGVGKRMAIAHTRALLRAALDGSLAGVPMRQDPNFGFLVPESCAEIPGNVLDPRGTWPDARGYDEIARSLRGRFESNFKEFEPYRRQRREARRDPRRGLDLKRAVPVAPKTGRGGPAGSARRLFGVLLTRRRVTRVFGTWRGPVAFYATC